MLLGGLQKTTLIDYPGKIACTIFVLGCNFRCHFCYALELVLPGKIKKQPKISEKEFFNFLEKRKGLLEAIVICGGEPTLQKDLPDFCRKIKKLGFLVKLDTNGSNPGMLQKLIDKKLVDYVAMDIKAPLGQFSKYEKVTGVKVDMYKIKKSVEILKKGNVDFEFRTTVVPTLHDKKDIMEIAEWIGGPNVKYFLQDFRGEKTIDKAFKKVKPYFKENLKEIQKTILKYFKACNVR